MRKLQQSHKSRDKATFKGMVKDVLNATKEFEALPNLVATKEELKALREAEKNTLWRSIWNKIKNVMRALLFILILSGCSLTQEPEAIVPPLKKTGTFIEGNWKGTNWYCNNATKCVSKPTDATSVIKFSITQVGEELTISNGTWHKANCQLPTCGTNPWEPTLIIFSNVDLRIEWSHGYTFTGKLQQDRFIGKVVYKYMINEYELSYVWNDSVQLLKE